jgi:hypothetical protein
MPWTILLVLPHPPRFEDSVIVHFSGILESLIFSRRTHPQRFAHSAIHPPAAFTGAHARTVPATPRVKPANYRERIRIGKGQSKNLRFGTAWHESGTTLGATPYCVPTSVAADRWEKRRFWRRSNKTWAGS